MKIERIKKNHKKKMIIGGVIIICLISTITITTSKAKYKLTWSIPLIQGTVNYSPDKTAPIITSVDISVTKTEIRVLVTATDNVGVTEYWYQLDENTPIKGIANTHKFTSLVAGANYSVKVYVKDSVGNQSITITKNVITSNPTSEDTLAKLNITDYKTTIPSFKWPATKDEGVYRENDGMYGEYSYYWRGAVVNNYVRFSDFCWRIVRINGDGTIRLIYDGTTCHANGVSTTENMIGTNWNYNYCENRSSCVGWTYDEYNQRPSINIPQTDGAESGSKYRAEKWFNENIKGSNAVKVADGKYCNDRRIASGSTWSINGNTFYYEAYNRIKTSYSPKLDCSSGDIYIQKVGFITADEVMYSGNSTESYLYNGHQYWTMSPAFWDPDRARVFIVDKYGGLAVLYAGGFNIDYTGAGIRPVINLKSEVTFSGGNGTQSNPYVVQ